MHLPAPQLNSGSCGISQLSKGLKFIKATISNQQSMLCYYDRRIMWHKKLASHCSAVGDDDVKVAKLVVSGVHILGFHVPPKKWLPVVLKPLESTKTSQAQVSFCWNHCSCCWSHLVVYQFQGITSKQILQLYILSAYLWTLWNELYFDLLNHHVLCLLIIVEIVLFMSREQMCWL